MKYSQKLECFEKRFNLFDLSEVKGEEIKMFVMYSFLMLKAIILSLKSEIYSEQQSRKLMSEGDQKSFICCLIRRVYSLKLK